MTLLRSCPKNGLKGTKKARKETLQKEYKVMAKNNIRIKIPRNIEKLEKLMDDILVKHVADGAASPLNNVIGANMLANFAVIKADISRLIQMRKDVETLTEKVQLAMGIRRGQKLNERNSIRFIVTSVRDILMGNYLGQEQSLGDWGFEVNYSPRKPKTGNPDA